MIINLGNIFLAGGGGGATPTPVDISVPALAQAIAELYEGMESLKRTIAYMGSVKVADIDCDRMPKVQGAPLVLMANGSPAEAVVPDNWDAATMGEWDGIPSFRGQLYINYAASSAVLYCANNNTAVSDWKTA